VTAPADKAGAGFFVLIFFDIAILSSTPLLQDTLRARNKYDSNHLSRSNNGELKVKFTQAAALIGASILTATPALAETGATGPYVALSGAAADSQKVGYSGDVGPTIAGKVSVKTAAEIKATVGYDFGLVRADAEVSYSRGRVNAVSLTSVGGTTNPNDANSVEFASLICGGFVADGSCTQSGNVVSVKGGSKIRQINALANVWVDLPIAERFHPYVGGGLGIAGFESEGEGRSVFAWQVGAGLAFDVTPQIALTVDYRHRQTSKLKDAFDIGVDLGRATTNTYGAGVRFQF
jgi:opacity protein-like surface antigen